jgi:hypothetical protein
MVKPWDLFNPNKKRSEEELYTYRLDICDTCPSLIQLTQQCKECGCIMPLKAKLKDATCPLGKW